MERFLIISLLHDDNFVLENWIPNLDANLFYRLLEKMNSVPTRYLQLQLDNSPNTFIFSSKKVLQE